MGRIAYTILAILRDNKALDKISAMTINEICSESSILKRITVYDNIRKMHNKGLLVIGINSGRERSYYLSSEAIDLLKEVSNER